MWEFGNALMQQCRSERIPKYVNAGMQEWGNAIMGEYGNSRMEESVEGVGPNVLFY